MNQKLSFGKAQRLIDTAEFARVRKDGRVWRGSLITLAVVAGSPGAKMRTGLVTSRRVGNAVERNRVRRRLREIVRRHQQEMIDGIWIVLIASSRAARATSQSLEDEWLRLAKHASILAP
jgi:ribonuclease P protein component